MSRKRIWSLKWQTRTKKNKLAIHRAWPWISNCWEWDPNSGLSGFESSALTTRPRRLGANLRRDATSRLLFLNQSVLADFDPRKKKLFEENMSERGSLEFGGERANVLKDQREGQATKGRLERKRQGVAVKRSSETSEQREERLTAKRKRAAFERSNE